MVYPQIFGTDLLKRIITLENTVASNSGVTSLAASAPLSASASTGAVTLSITTPVSVANGGTGAGTLTGVVIGNGTGAFTSKSNPAGAFLGDSDTQTVTNKDVTSATNTFPTFNQNTTGSAAKWTTARNLAGNSVDGSANVAFANKFIVQGTADTGLSAAQFLGALGTGILKNTTTTGVLTIAVAGDFPTLNQNTSGSAATLTTPRAIYGNNFDGSAALAQIIASTYGGTGNGFTKFSGPATAEKTFTLPNASANVLTDNALVTVLQGGTGVSTSTGSGNLVLSSSPTLTTPTIADFTNATHDHSSVAKGGTIAAAGLPTVTKRTTMALRARTVAATAAAFPNASSAIVSVYAQVPDDYVSGNITLKALHRGTGSTGNWRMQSDSYRFRDGAAFVQVDNAVLSTIASTTNSKLFSSTFGSTNFAAGDVIRWDITRLGADAADTSVQDSEFDGAWMEYTGYQ